MSRKTLMLSALAIAATLAASSAQAQTYPWCAVYNPGGWGDVRNCGFTSLEQCRATISGVGGICQPNPFYKGRTTDGRGARRKQSPQPN